MDPYVYTPLPSGDSIRVMTVQSVDDLATDIRCSLQPIPISKDSLYMALSYSWGMDKTGDTSICERILVDGKALGITRNLDECLRRLYRGRDDELPIWIDAVCIDQQNLDERNSQVAKMAEIYANASQVNVWLGEGDEPADNDRIATVLDCLLQRRHRHYSEHVVTTRKGQSARLCLAQAGIAAAFALNDLRTSDSFRPPPDDFPTSLPDCVRYLFNAAEMVVAAQEMERLLISLLTKRYWSRRWVIQELFHPDFNNVYLFWGEHSIGMHQFLAALKRLPGRFYWQEVGNVLGLQLDLEGEHDISATANRVGLMLRLSQNTRNRKDLLARSLECSNGFDCSDPRDRLFALLSIDPRTQIRPDYRLSADRVYSIFCADIINSNNDLLSDLLYAAASQKTQGAYDDKISRSLPSWCLDLREDFRHLPRMNPIASCSIDNYERLTCSAMVIDTMPFGSHCEHRSSGGSVQYIYSNTWRDGDLLCVFRQIEASEGTIQIPAIILQEAEHNADMHRIVGLCLLQWHQWHPHKYPVRTVTIC